MLQEETDKGDANPAAGTEENRLTAFLDEVHKVCVEPNGSHGKNDEKLAKGLHRSKDSSRNAQMNAYGRDDRSKDKVKDEHRKYAFGAYGAAFARPTTSPSWGGKSATFRGALKLAACTPYCSFSKKIWVCLFCTNRPLKALSVKVGSCASTLWTFPSPMTSPSFGKKAAFLARLIGDGAGR